MITYNLTEELLDRLLLVAGTITIEQYCLQYGASFDWMTVAEPHEPGYWGTVTFTEPEKLTWFLLNL